jgi:hypothetical protein
VTALTVAVAGPCPRSADSWPHRWEPGASADLVGFGVPDHGVSVYLGRCRCCAVPLLAVVPVSQEFRGSGPFLEVHGAQL